VPLCNGFNDALILPFRFKYFESVVLYIILLEVARELSHFCEMAWSSKVVGPRWIKLLSSIKPIVVHVSLRTRTEEEWKFHRGGMKSSKMNKERNASKKVGNHCPKFWKPRYGFALYWSKTIWDKHVFLHVAFATDSCSVIGPHNFLAQKLEAKIVSLVSVHCHAHRFGLNYYTAADLYSMVYETAKAL